MSSDIRQTENYVWSINDRLGNGATSQVYRGFDKRDGRPVAIKSFSNYYENFYTKNREFDVLKKVNHENIVKLLAIETEVTETAPPKQLIITELCTGGSVADILKQPENWNGLNDTDFLLILSHLTAGMKYLRHNDLIHRDLKPGNIMKFIKEEDGSVVYKLIDFGGARELSDDKEFKSIFGTEEYLNPHMYETALLNGNSSNTFKATVDLWSMGVTIYHLATGDIPFRPYKGRKDKAMMHAITTKKEDGVISGIQYESNGPVFWSRTLPKTCRLSESLQKIITPIIAGLLESDIEKTWTFQKFFEEIDAVLTRKPLDIFSVYTANLRKLYLSSGDQLKEAIHKSTGILPEDQILIYKSQIFDGDGDLPITTCGSPLLVLVKNNANVICYSLQVPRYPINFPSIPNINTDDKLARKSSFGAHNIKRLIKECVDNIVLINYAVKNLCHYLDQQYINVYSDYTKLQEIILKVKRTVAVFMKMRRHNKWPSSDEELDTIMQSVSVNTRENLKNSWEEMIARMNNPFQTSAEIRAQKLAEQLDSARIHLMIGRDIPIDQTKQYQFERQRIKIALDSQIKLLENEVYPQAKLLCEKFSVWYTLAHKYMRELEESRASVRQAEEQLKMFELKLDEELASFDDENSKEINNKDEQIKKKPNNVVVNNYLKNKLKQYARTTASNEIIQESRIIMENVSKFNWDIDKHKISFD